MAQKEKFGKFVLLEQVDSTSLGTEHRAAKLGQGGLEKIVSLIRLASAFSSNTEIAKSLMDQAKTAAQLQNPNIQKLLGIGKVEGSYYLSYEYVEGKSLRSIFDRCRQEGFPMSVDHALLVASKICSALEHAHSRKIEGMGRYAHGFLTPRNVIVSYEGELKVRGFGYWSAGIWSAGFVTDVDSVYLAPEQVAGQAAETRSDIFSIGAILFEALAGRPLFEPRARTRDTAALINAARLHCAPGDDEPLPKPIAEILIRSLAPEPDGRQLEVQELRKAIDTLLFSGDFTPTTFNLAFFMHSLFRDDIERESKALKQERDASYFEFLAEEKPKAVEAPAAPAPSPVPPPVVVTPPLPPFVPAPAAVPPQVEPSAPARMTPLPAPPPFSQPASAPMPPPLPLVPPPPIVSPPIFAPARAATPIPPPLFSTTPVPRAHEHAPSVPPHRPSPPVVDTAPAPMFGHTEAPARGGMGVMAIVIGVLVLGGVGGYFAYQKMSTPRTVSTTLSPQLAAALDKQKKLEEELLRLQTDADEKRRIAEEEARKQAEEEARKQGRIAAQAELEAAARKAREEQERKQREERERLEKLRQEEETRIAEERRKQDEERKHREDEERQRAAAATPPPPPTTQASIPPAQAIYGADSPGVKPPVRKCGAPPFPPIAVTMGVSGTVRIMFLVDETGRTSDVRFLSGPDVFKQPAIDFIARCSFEPAMKDKTRVKFRMLLALQYAKPR